MEESLFIPRCFKCSEYNHAQNDCTNGDVCVACDGPHPFVDCKAQNFFCINCQRAGLDIGDHRADNAQCPIYLAKLRFVRTWINYG